MPVRYEGGILWRVDGEKRHHVSGTKGYRWADRDLAKLRYEYDELFTDMDYFDELKNKAVAAIEQFVPFDELIN